MAIDFGTRNSGLAISDAGQALAFPLTTITASKPDQMIRRIQKEIALQQPIDLIIVGAPLGLAGKPTKMSKAAHTFAQTLTLVTKISHLLWDETYTSQIAQNAPGTGSNHEQAARIILQEYLDHLAANKAA